MNPLFLPRTVDEAAMVDMADMDTAVTVGAAVMVDAAVTAVMVETVVMAAGDSANGILLDAQAKVEMVHVGNGGNGGDGGNGVPGGCGGDGGNGARGGDGGNIHIQFGDTASESVRYKLFSSALLVDKVGMVDEQVQSYTGSGGQQVR